MTPDDIELAFVREFSVSGNLIGMTVSRNERRERVRQAIYVSDKANERFHDPTMTYSEAFRICYGERLDRRVATRALPDPGDDIESDKWAGFNRER
jgi:hypothetical protein